MSSAGERLPKNSLPIFVNFFVSAPLCRSLDAFLADLMPSSFCLFSLLTKSIFLTVLSNFYMEVEQETNMDKHVSSTPSEIELTPTSDLIEQEVIRKSQLHSNQKLTNEQRRHCCHLLVRLSTNPADKSRYNLLYQALNSPSFNKF